MFPPLGLYSPCLLNELKYSGCARSLPNFLTRKRAPAPAGICEAKLEASVEPAAMPVAAREVLRHLAAAGRVRAEEAQEPRALPPFYDGAPCPPPVGTRLQTCSRLRPF